MRRYPGGGAFALFFHPHPREFATQNKKSANARGLARGGGGWAQLELTDALVPHLRLVLFKNKAAPIPLGTSLVLFCCCFFACFLSLVFMTFVADLPLAVRPAGEASKVIKACPSFFIVMASGMPRAYVLYARTTSRNIRDMTFSFVA